MKKQIETLFLKTTEDCNLRCPFCIVPRRAVSLDFETIKENIIKYKPTTIVFHGGEPLMTPGILLKIMKEFPDITYTMTSNLTLPLTKERLEVIDKVDSLGTSYSKDRFENNEKAFQKFKENIKQYNLEKRAGLLVTLSRHQLDEDPKELVKVIDEIGFKNVLFERLYEDNITEENFKKLAEKTDEYLMKLVKLIPPPKNLLTGMMLESIKTNHAVFMLDCFKTNIVLNADGTTGHCTSICKVQQEPKKENFHECYMCDYFQYCKGDCASFRSSVCYFPKKTFQYVMDNYKELKSINEKNKTTI